jgi:hypothetical protein
LAKRKPSHRSATAADWRKALVAALRRSDVSGGRRITRLAAVADACVAAAMAGNVQAIREIAARLEAKDGAGRPAAVRIIHTFKSAL